MAAKKPSTRSRSKKPLVVEEALRSAANIRLSNDAVWSAIRKVHQAYTDSDKEDFQAAFDALLMHPSLEPSDPDRLLLSAQRRGFLMRAIFRNPAVSLWLLTDRDRTTEELGKVFKEEYSEEFSKVVKRETLKTLSGLQRALEGRFEVKQPYDLGALSDKGRKQAFAVIELLELFGKNLVGKAPKLDLGHLLTQIIIRERNIAGDLRWGGDYYSAEDFVRFARALERAGGLEPMLLEESKILFDF